ncbi:uncharacterized protein LOC120260034 [Dioscorea cayenensis subsp. rotundata]|uniref:Uncharacterized protein LOC120260034 n=1 Tax=Dioscorea cayennensis subsp. rotundata TaxID=55577 RepID=A0AB40B830_DIOCR|nr:uncharacterized protein LOC120260034 [Dioscorea cayenensis subsp. rotundata]
MGVSPRLQLHITLKLVGKLKSLTMQLKRIFGEMRESARKDWTDHLDDALWAYRTAYKTPLEQTLIKSVYREACHLPVELELIKASWAIKQINFDPHLIGHERKFQLSELDEWRTMAYDNSLLYKKRIKEYHDRHIKQGWTPRQRIKLASVHVSPHLSWKKMEFALHEHWARFE